MPLPEAGHALEPVVLDGSNIAHHVGLRRGGFQALLELEAAFVDSGWGPLVVVDATLRHRLDPDEQDALEACLDDGWMQAPKGTDADRIILAEAARLGALVVSGDRFRDALRPPPRRLDPATLWSPQGGPLF